MSRSTTQDLEIGKSHRFHKVGFQVVVDDGARSKIAMRDAEALLQTRLTSGEAMKLAAVLQTAARVAEC
jgi:hypothetical protein